MRTCVGRGADVFPEISADEFEGSVRRAGEIEPLDDDPSRLEKWAAVFGAANLPPAPLAKRVGRWLLRVALGIELADPEARGVQRYSVAKPMLGFVDVLFADGDIRVTRGNRGTLVVARAEEPPAKKGFAK